MRSLRICHMHEFDAIEMLMPGEAALGGLSLDDGGGRIGPIGVAAFAVGIVGEALDHRARGIGDGLNRPQMIVMQIALHLAARAVGLAESDELVAGIDIIGVRLRRAGIEALVAHGAVVEVVAGAASTRALDAPAVGASLFFHQCAC